MSEASENLDFDLRVQPQDSLPSDTPLSPPVIGQSIPKELSLSQHSEIIIQVSCSLFLNPYDHGFIMLNVLFALGYFCYLKATVHKSMFPGLFFTNS